jgi:hypothetical protein
VFSSLDLHMLFSSRCILLFRRLKNIKITRKVHSNKRRNTEVLRDINISAATVRWVFRTVGVPYGGFSVRWVFRTVDVLYGGCSVRWVFCTHVCFCK